MWAEQEPTILKEQLKACPKDPIFGLPIITSQELYKTITNSFSMIVAPGDLPSETFHIYSFPVGEHDPIEYLFKFLEGKLRIISLPQHQFSKIDPVWQQGFHSLPEEPLSPSEVDYIDTNIVYSRDISDGIIFDFVSEEDSSEDNPPGLYFTTTSLPLLGLVYYTSAPKVMREINGYRIISGNEVNDIGAKFSYLDLINYYHIHCRHIHDPINSSEAESILLQKKQKLNPFSSQFEVRDDIPYYVINREDRSLLMDLDTFYANMERFPDEVLDLILGKKKH